MKLGFKAINCHYGGAVDVKEVVEKLPNNIDNQSFVDNTYKKLRRKSGLTTPMANEQ